MIVITSAAKRMLLGLLERRCGERAHPDGARPTGASGRCLRLHSVTRTGLLGVALDRPRPGDHTVELGRGELLLVDDALARVVEGFVLDQDERGSLSLRTTGPPPAATAPAARMRGRVHEPPQGEARAGGDREPRAAASGERLDEGGR